MIEIKKSHKGLLHKHLGVKQGTHLSALQLHSAANSHDAKIRKEAQFALNARKWKHK